jgi:hypothetical protein
MAQPTVSSTADPLTIPARRSWEDPCLTLERDLEARAQGGPDTQGMLGPLNISGSECLATPTP